MIENVMARSQEALKELQKIDTLRPYMDVERGLPTPFMGSGKIRLVIVGQDPTVDRIVSREQITTVPMLDDSGSVLRRFLSGMCASLGISLDENVYATNLCKNFFTVPPTQIKNVDVIAASAPVWLPVLDDELQQYPDALVMSLGQSVLSALLKPGFPQQVRDCWGYHGANGGAFSHILPDQSRLNRAIFPMVHLRSWQTKVFYRDNWAGYLRYIRGQMA